MCCWSTTRRRRPATRLTSAQGSLVVEVVSDGSQAMDRVTKPHEYALAGIRECWIVNYQAGPLSVCGLEELTDVYAQVATGSRVSVFGASGVSS